MADVLEVIHTRRSVGQVTPERPPRAAIEAMLEAATYAPNHFRNDPWRFVVIAGDARHRLGEAMAAVAARGMADPTTPEAQTALAAERARALRSPVIIAVGVVDTGHPRALQIEDIEATAAAIQNMLLVARAHGLTAYWRTGAVAYDPEFKAHFGLKPHEHLSGLLYVGYPAVEPAPRERTPWTALTEWRGWEE